MNGQLVIVKAFASQPLLKKVCYSDEKTVFVTSEEAFDLIKNGVSGLYPIGFRAENVFHYDGQPLSAPFNWSSLKPWQG